MRREQEFCQEIIYNETRMGKPPGQQRQKIGTLSVAFNKSCDTVVFYLSEIKVLDVSFEQFKKCKAEE